MDKEHKKAEKKATEIIAQELDEKFQQFIEEDNDHIKEKMQMNYLNFFKI